MRRRRRNPNISYRSIALLGGAIGLLSGSLQKRVWGVVTSTLLGMLLAPLILGASSRDLGRALFLPERLQNPSPSKRFLDRNRRLT